jgi:site-specific recombinase XerD
MVRAVTEAHQGANDSVHGIQHTSATLLLNAGVPAQVVQQRLGHKRIGITPGL